MIFKFVNSNIFHFIVLSLVLLLFIYHLNENFDVNSNYFVNINAIKAVEAEDQFFTIDTNTLLNNNNINNYKIIQIKQSDNEMKNIVRMIII